MCPHIANGWISTAQQERDIPMQIQWFTMRWHMPLRAEKLCSFWDR